MPNCSVFYCKKKSQTSSLLKDDVSFHLFPKDYRRNIWIKACGNHPTWLPKRTSTICSEHFDQSSFISQSNKRKLIETAVPTLKLSEVKPFVIEEPPTKKRKKDLIEPEEIYIVEQPSEAISQPPKTLETASTNSESTLSPEPEKPASSFTHNLHYVRNQKLKQRLKQKRIQIKRLQSQIRYLKSKVDTLQELLDDLFSGKSEK